MNVPSPAQVLSSDIHCGRVRSRNPGPALRNAIYDKELSNYLRPQMSAFRIDLNTQILPALVPLVPKTEKRLDCPG
jgi:hypothetical protein